MNSASDNGWRAQPRDIVIAHAANARKSGAAKVVRFAGPGAVLLLIACPGGPNARGLARKRMSGDEGVMDRFVDLPAPNSPPGSAPQVAA